MTNPDIDPGMGDAFPQSMWTLIANSQNDSEAVSGKALESLCRMYWLPIYGYIRGHGRGPEDAQDLTQSYFMNLLARGYIRRASREKGKFRAFLLADVKLFLGNERRRDKSQKRGGDQLLIPMGEAWVEGKITLLQDAQISPDQQFDRQWATALLERVMESLRIKYEDRNKPELFDALKQFISWNEGGESYAGVASRLGKEENYIKVNVHRLRGDFRKLLEEEVSHTVSSPEEIAGEIRYLAAALC